jgi:hypothetical protein
MCGGRGPGGRAGNSIGGGRDRGGGTRLTRLGWGCLKAFGLVVAFVMVMRVHLSGPFRKEDVVVRARAPRPRDLHDPAKRPRVVVGEHAERNLAREDGERVEPTQVRKRDSPIPNLTSTQRSPCSH